MNGDNVIQMADSRPPFPPPDFFKVRQARAWNELVAQTAPALHVKENYFTFEIAATLLAKFRSGRTMTATEIRTMQGYLAALGLRSEIDGPVNRKRPNSHYFGSAK